MIEVINFLNREMSNLSELYFFFIEEVLVSFVKEALVIALSVNVTHICKILRDENKAGYNLKIWLIHLKLPLFGESFLSLFYPSSLRGIDS